MPKESRSQKQANLLREPPYLHLPFWATLDFPWKTLIRKNSTLLYSILLLLMSRFLVVNLGTIYDLWFLKSEVQSWVQGRQLIGEQWQICARAMYSKHMSFLFKSQISIIDSFSDTTTLDFDSFSLGIPKTQQSPKFEGSDMLSLIVCWMWRRCYE